MSAEEQSGRTIGHDVIALWRVAVAVFVTQWVGHVLGLLFIAYHDSFMRGWIGGAVATPAGFAIGLGWYFLKVRRLTLLPGLLLAGLALVSLFLGGSGVMEYRAAMRANEVAADLRSLPADAFDRIEVRHEYRDELLFTIDDPEALKAFARGLADSEDYKPNHPRYTDSWHLRTVGRREYEIYCHFQEAHPDAVVVSVIVSDSLLFPNKATLISRNLRPWFEEHVVQSGPE